MTVVLSQSAAAAFPDRNPEGFGLRADLLAGGGGRFLELPLGDPPGPCFSRFLFHPQDAEGGGLTLSGGVDAQGRSAWSLRYDAVSNTLTLQTHPGTATVAALADNSTWTSVEVGYDPDNLSVSWWINGIEAGSLPLSADPPAIARVWLGGLQKDSALTGLLYFDEWAIDNEYLGPVRVEPRSEHADDPSRWLVVYNVADAESVHWVASYRSARGVPHANCVGLDLPSEESIGTTEYENMLGAIESYLDRNRLRGTIMGVLAGYRVPGYVVPSGTSFRYPVVSLLHLATPYYQAVPNPLATESVGERIRPQDLNQARLTARIDAPDLSSAMRLHERALELAEAPLASGDGLYVDPTTGGPVLDWSQRLIAWHSSVDRQRLRLNSTLSGDPLLDNDAQFSSIDQDAFYWGWGGQTPPPGFFAEYAGSRVACVQLRPAGTEATTLRDPTPSHWVDRALDAGYAVAVGASLGVSTDSLLEARPFFEALRRGWTLGEAYFLAAPQLQDGFYLVGDPLLQIQLSRAGWDVFGPLGRLQDLDPQSPTAALPDHEHAISLTEADRPTEGGAGFYLVRRTDQHGRSEANARPLQVGRHAGAPALTPPPAAWPNHEGWNIELRGNSASAVLVLGVPAGVHLLEAIELVDDRDGPPRPAPVDPRATVVTLTFSAPLLPTRYRWRLAAVDGLQVHTPWSIPLDAPVVSDVALTVLEPA